MVEELAPLARPADLHDSRCDDLNLVVPDSPDDLEGGADALEGGGVAARLEAVGADLEVLRHVVVIQHRVDPGGVLFKIGESPILDQDWNIKFVLFISVSWDCHCCSTLT